MGKVIVLAPLTEGQIDGISGGDDRLVALIKDGFRQGEVAFKLALSGPADYILLHRTINGCVVGHFGFAGDEHWCVVGISQDAIDLFRS